ncbi:hypothetical protein [Escherichia coli]|uniref:hypothetical protein n=1 Tax=Escherichia coli TaxID=562 RepID=UPI000CFB76FA|nr:hypothetical protein [Escherichia coli]
MCGVGKSKTLNIVLSKTPDKEICGYSTSIVDVSDWDVVAVWCDILEMCEKSTFSYIIVKDKAGFLRDDSELPYDVAEIVSACNRGGKTVLAIKLNNGKLLLEKECQEMHNFVNSTCGEGDLLAYCD